MTKKAVILFSGGLDSTTCLAVAKAEGYECHALTFDYGQKHRIEIEAASRIAKHESISHRIFKLDLHQFGGSALTDANLSVPNYESNSESTIPNVSNIPITYVPARNTIFLSIALAYAESLNAKNIYIGVSAVDYSGYPDCRPEYLKSFETLANLATKMGALENGIHIHAPLIHLSKAQTIQLGNQFNAPYFLTVSCYRANAQGQACGHCDSCHFRKKGFEEAGVCDPTNYV